MNGLLNVCIYSPLYSTYCIRHLGDGNCDSGCNTRGCNYDGGDCSGTKENRNVLGGAVALVLTVEPEVFANRSQEFLMTLGKVRVQVFLYMAKIGK